MTLSRSPSRAASARRQSSRREVAPRLLRRAATTLLGLLVLAASAVASYCYPTPLLASYRPQVLAAAWLLTAGCVALAMYFRVHSNRTRLWATCVAVGSTVSALWLTRVELQMRADVDAVLSAPAGTLERIGAHVMVGYRDADAVRMLVERRAIAGVYITQRNIQGKSVAQLAREIADLQAIRGRQGLPPLIVATDHEGGPVAHLSPPLSHTPRLAEVASGAGDRWRSAVDAYAFSHAKQLRSVGVNLNFAPVVDLHVPGAVLASRALAEDPQRVAELARTYCEGLARQQVGCTLKHFPGLGHVRQDTHWRIGEISQTRDQLEREAWQPFTRAHTSAAAIMVGHTIVSAVDPEHPSSVSRELLEGVLREAWGFDGVVITDDLSMLPIALRDGGAPRAAVEALNHGADVVLVAYDTQLAYEVLHGLIRAQLNGSLDERQLARSRARLYDSKRRSQWRSRSSSKS